MRTYEERAMDFIKELYEVKGTNTFMKNYGVRRIVAEYLSLHPRRKVKVAEGAARTAIITSDYVIKIDTGMVDTYGGCENEEEFYEYACECSMEYLLAKPTHFRYKRTDFYIYPRASVYTDFMRHRSWRSELSYAEREFIDLIDDLHEGNIGFLHGKLCIIDYAMNTF